MKFCIRLKGGPGSGHRGHTGGVGGPGKPGGSTSGVGGIGDAWGVRDALKADKKMTFQHGNWTPVEGRVGKGRYNVTVGDTDYSVKIGQSKVYGKGRKGSRLRVPSKTKTVTYIELVSRKQGRSLSATLYERSVRGEGGETVARIGKTVQVAIRYMDRRFGISGIGEYDLAFR